MGHQLFDVNLLFSDQLQAKRPRVLVAKDTSGQERFKVQEVEIT